MRGRQSGNQSGYVGRFVARQTHANQQRRRVMDRGYGKAAVVWFGSYLQMDTSENRKLDTADKHFQTKVKNNENFKTSLSVSKVEFAKDDELLSHKYGTEKVTSLEEISISNTCPTEERAEMEGKKEDYCTTNVNEMKTRNLNKIEDKKIEKVKTNRPTGKEAFKVGKDDIDKLENYSKNIDEITEKEKPEKESEHEKDIAGTHSREQVNIGNERMSVVEPVAIDINKHQTEKNLEGSQNDASSKKSNNEFYLVADEKVSLVKMGHKVEEQVHTTDTVSLAPIQIYSANENTCSLEFGQSVQLLTMPAPLVKKEVSKKDSSGTQASYSHPEAGQFIKIVKRPSEEKKPTKQLEKQDKVVGNVTENQLENTVKGLLTLNSPVAQVEKSESKKDIDSKGRVDNLPKIENYFTLKLENRINIEEELSVTMSKETAKVDAQNVDKESDLVKDSITTEKRPSSEIKESRSSLKGNDNLSEVTDSNIKEEKLSTKENIQRVEAHPSSEKESSFSPIEHIYSQYSKEDKVDENKAGSVEKFDEKRKDTIFNDLLPTESKEIFETQKGGTPANDEVRQRNIETPVKKDNYIHDKVDSNEGQIDINLMKKRRSKDHLQEIDVDRGNKIEEKVSPVSPKTEIDEMVTSNQLKEGTIVAEGDKVVSKKVDFLKGDSVDSTKTDIYETKHILPKDEEIPPSEENSNKVKKERLSSNDESRLSQVDGRKTKKDTFSANEDIHKPELDSSIKHLEVEETHHFKVDTSESIKNHLSCINNSLQSDVSTRERIRENYSSDEAIYISKNNEDFNEKTPLRVKDIETSEDNKLGIEDKFPRKKENDQTVLSSFPHKVDKYSEDESKRDVYETKHSVSELKESTDIRKEEVGSSVRSDNESLIAKDIPKAKESEWLENKIASDESEIDRYIPIEDRGLFKEAKDIPHTKINTEISKTNSREVMYTEDPIKYQDSIPGKKILEKNNSKLLLEKDHVSSPFDKYEARKITDNTTETISLLKVDSNEPNENVTSLTRANRAEMSNDMDKVYPDLSIYETKHNISEEESSVGIKDTSQDMESVECKMNSRSKRLEPNYQPQTDLSYLKETNSHYSTIESSPTNATKSSTTQNILSDTTRTEKEKKVTEWDDRIFEEESIETKKEIVKTEGHQSKLDTSVINEDKDRSVAEVDRTEMMQKKEKLLFKFDTINVEEEKTKHVSKVDSTKVREKAKMPLKVNSTEIEEYKETHQTTVETSGAKETTRNVSTDVSTGTNQMKKNKEDEDGFVPKVDSTQIKIDEDLKEKTRRQSRVDKEKLIKDKTKRPSTLDSTEVNIEACVESRVDGTEIQVDSTDIKEDITKLESTVDSTDIKEDITKLESTVDSTDIKENTAKLESTVDSTDIKEDITKLESTVDSTNIKEDKSKLESTVDSTNIKEDNTKLQSTVDSTDIKEDNTKLQSTVDSTNIKEDNTKLQSTVDSTDIKEDNTKLESTVDSTDIKENTTKLESTVDSTDIKEDITKLQSTVDSTDIKEDNTKLESTVDSTDIKEDKTKLQSTVDSTDIKEDITKLQSTVDSTDIKEDNTKLESTVDSTDIKEDKTKLQSTVDSTDIKEDNTKLQSTVDSTDIKEDITKLESTVDSTNIKDDNTKLQSTVDSTDIKDDNTKLQSTVDSTDIKENTTKLESTVDSTDIKGDKTKLQSTVDSTDIKEDKTKLESTVDSTDIKEDNTKLESTVDSTDIKENTTKLESTVDSTDIKEDKSKLQSTVDSTDIKEDNTKLESTVDSTDIKEDITKLESTVDSTDIKENTAKLESTVDSTDIKEDITKLESTVDSTNIKEDKSKLESTVDSTNIKEDNTKLQSTVDSTDIKEDNTKLQSTVDSTNIKEDNTKLQSTVDSTDIKEDNTKLESTVDSTDIKENTTKLESTVDSTDIKEDITKLQSTVDSTDIKEDNTKLESTVDSTDIKEDKTKLQSTVDSTDIKEDITKLQSTVDSTDIKEDNTKLESTVDSTDIKEDKTKLQSTVDSTDIKEDNTKLQSTVDSTDIKEDITKLESTVDSTNIKDDNTKLQSTVDSTDIKDDNTKLQSTVDSTDIKENTTKLESTVDSTDIKGDKTKLQSTVDSTDIKEDKTKLESTVDSTDIKEDNTKLESTVDSTDIKENTTKLESTVDSTDIKEDKSKLQSTVDSTDIKEDNTKLESTVDSTDIEEDKSKLQSTVDSTDIKENTTKLESTVDSTDIKEDITKLKSTVDSTDIKEDITKVESTVDSTDIKEDKTKLESTVDSTDIKEDNTKLQSTVDSTDIKEDNTKLQSTVDSTDIKEDNTKLQSTVDSTDIKEDKSKLESTVDSTDIKEDNTKLESTVDSTDIKEDNTKLQSTVDSTDIKEDNTKLQSTVDSTDIKEDKSKLQSTVDSTDIKEDNTKLQSTVDSTDIKENTTKLQSTVNSTNIKEDNTKLQSTVNSTNIKEDNTKLESTVDSTDIKEDKTKLQSTVDSTDIKENTTKLESTVDSTDIKENTTKLQSTVDSTDIEEDNTKLQSTVDSTDIKENTTKLESTVDSTDIKEDNTKLESTVDSTDIKEDGNRKQHMAIFPANDVSGKQIENGLNKINSTKDRIIANDTSANKRSFLRKCDSYETLLFPQEIDDNKNLEETERNRSKKGKSPTLDGIYVSKGNSNEAMIDNRPTDVYDYLSEISPLAEKQGFGFTRDPMTSSEVDMFETNPHKIKNVSLFDEGRYETNMNAQPSTEESLIYKECSYEPSVKLEWVSTDGILAETEKYEKINIKDNFLSQLDDHVIDDENLSRSAENKLNESDVCETSEEHEINDIYGHSIEIHGEPRNDPRLEALKKRKYQLFDKMEDDTIEENKSVTCEIEEMNFEDALDGWENFAKSIRMRRAKIVNLDEENNGVNEAEETNFEDAVDSFNESQDSMQLVKRERSHDKKEKTNRLADILKLINKGGFAKCYEVSEVGKPQEVYACKIVPKAILLKNQQREKMFQEISIHRSLSHKNVVRFVNFFEDENFIYIILELCRCRSLMEMHKRRQAITEPETQFFLKQIVEACQYLHANKIIHRDLKLGNLFLSEDLDIKIGDFGLATVLDFEGQRKKTLCGTPNYIAPEVLSKKGHSFEVDVWSLGCIVYTLLVGKPPFETSSLKDTYNKIKKNDYDIPPHVSPKARFLIHKLLQADPNHRPNMDQIMTFDFFKEPIPKRLPISCLSNEPRIDANRITRVVYENATEVGLRTGGCSNEKENAGVKNKLPQVRQNPDENSSCHLNLLSKMLATVVNVKNNNRELMEEEYENPAAIPLYWISKWVDYSDKYGIGYMLCDNSFGVLFNDSTRLIVMANEEYMEYIDRNNVESYFTMTDYPDEHKKKVILLKYFRSYMSEHLLKAGAGIRLQEADKYSRLPFLKSWFRTKSAINLYLSNGTVQINFFEDHTKIILCPVMGAVTYIDEKRNCKTYRFLTLGEHGVTKDLFERLFYSKTIVDRFISRSLPLRPKSKNVK
ncbi:mucin-5AC-like isoform X1 [Argonauta hians]